MWRSHMKGIILYGPPAAGKDTTTEALHRLDPRFRLFHKLKVGGGKTETYRIVDRRNLELLRRTGHILWENTRYGAIYAIDRTGLQTALQQSIPIVYLGQPEAISTVLSFNPHAKW
ncbi:MAG: hypothetical protein ACRCTR_09410 [Actinomycetota bacterium]